MRSILQSIGIDRLLRPLPTRVVGLLTVGSAAILGLDFFLLDPLPFLDEALLALLAVAGYTELSDRKKIAAGSPPTGRVRGVRGAAAELKTLPNRVAALLAHARTLREEGCTVAGLDGLPALREVVKDLLGQLKTSDGFLSRKENDPWLLDQRITKLERRSVQAEQDGDGRQRDASTSELEAVRAHRLRVANVVAEREDVLDQLNSLSAQVDALTGDLAALQADPDATDFSVASLREVHPRVAAVLTSVEEAVKAEAELEEALEAGRQAARPRAPHLH